MTSLRRAASAVLCSFSLIIPAFGAGESGGPDLIVSASELKPFTQTRTFDESCEVVEGCTPPGTRRLLRFNLQTRNQGTADLVLGRPEDNPLFKYAECHRHYHFERYCGARLLDLSGGAVSSDYKIGFCLEDTDRWDTNASPTALYDCEFQGLQSGWADTYHPNLPCQYLDITDTPAGDYVLEVAVDPDNLLAEINEGNNVVRLPVTLPGPCVGPPSNDAFETATAITSGRVHLSDNSECASAQPEESPVAGGLGHSVWFRWTSPFSGPAMISTDGSTFDSVLGIYTGQTLGSLAIVAENDDGGFGRNAFVRLNATSGAVYHIKLDGHVGQGGDFTLNIVPGTNDHFASCFPLAGAAGNIRDYNIYTTAEPGEPAHAGNPAFRSLWYCWTAPTTGLMSVDTANSVLDTVLAVYTGNSLANLSLVASNDDQPPLNTSRVTFHAVSNTTYRIAVDGWRGFLGMVLLRWGPPVAMRAEDDGGALRLWISGAPGDRYAIEASTNLREWTIWRRASNTNGLLQINEQINPPGTYYRVRLE
jgi:hypothetical protein